jgi:hypothetical protein
VSVEEEWEAAVDPKDERGRTSRRRAGGYYEVHGEIKGAPRRGWIL